jgi:predicted DNA-binding protein with PD1-like motif
MVIKKCENFYVARLEESDEIIAALRTAAKKLPLSSAFFLGLGVGKNLVLGYFNARTRKYTKKVFEGEFEFTSFSGNISRFKKEIVVHCHVTITNDSFNAFGGHLFQAVVPATMEVLFIPIRPGLKRYADRSSGLKLIDLA